MHKYTIGSICLFLLAGCAKSPESIQAAYISDIPFRKWSCADLVEEKFRLQSAYNVAALQQKKARSNDAAGIFWLGVPVASVSGDNIAPEIARLKGEQEAVRKVIVAKKCTVKL